MPTKLIKGDHCASPPLYRFDLHIAPPRLASTSHWHQLQQVATICKKGEAPPLLYFKHRYRKRVQTTISSLHPSLRRERDSNPRYLAVQRISRPPHSTTLPSLRGHHKEKANDFSSLMHCKDTHSHRVNEIPPQARTTQDKRLPQSIHSGVASCFSPEGRALY